MHPSITQERVAEALERYHRNCDNPGFCRACGAEADCCEPDAESYFCVECGEFAVAGAETIYLSLIDKWEAM